VKPGLFRSERHPYRTSCHNVLIVNTSIPSAEC
jgi:hypothetical protein